MFIALLLPFISIPVCYAASGTSYTYEKQSTWSGSCQSGTEQSPIDLNINQAKGNTATNLDLSFVSYARKSTIVQCTSKGSYRC